MPFCIFNSRPQRCRLAAYHTTHLTRNDFAVGNVATYTGEGRRATLIRRRQVRIADRRPGELLVAAVARARRHKVTCRLGRCTDSVVTHHASIWRYAIVTELCRQPGSCAVASIAGCGHHQVTGRHSGRIFSVVAGLALGGFHALVVEAIAQHTA